MDVLKITKDNFDREVRESKVPVLIDFWASWCGPCNMQAPVIDEIADEYDTIKVGKINVDEERALAMEFGINSIPTLICFKDGKAAEKLIGLNSKEDIARAFKL